MARTAAKPLLLTSALLGVWLGITGACAEEPSRGPPPPGHPPPVPPPPPPPRPIGTVESITVPVAATPALRPDDEAIRKSVAQRAGATQALAKLRVSIGTQATSTSGYDLEPLFQRADAALYAAKRSGRDRVAIESEHDTAPTDQPSLRQLSVTAVEGEAAGSLVI